MESIGEHVISRFWSDIVHDLVPYTPGEQVQMPGLIKLNTNENPYGPSPQAIAAIRGAVGSTMARSLPLNCVSGPFSCGTSDGSHSDSHAVSDRARACGFPGRTRIGERGVSRRTGVSLPS